MPGREPLSPEDEEKVLRILPEKFCLRDQALIVTGLNTGFRITELLSHNVGQVWERGAVRPRVRVMRAHLKNGKGRRKTPLTSRTVPLNAAAAAILEKFLFARFGSGPADPNAPLFPSQRQGMRMSRWRANVSVYLVVRTAGIADHEAYGITVQLVANGEVLLPRQSECRQSCDVQTTGSVRELLRIAESKRAMDSSDAGGSRT